MRVTKKMGQVDRIRGRLSIGMGQVDHVWGRLNKGKSW